MDLALLLKTIVIGIVEGLTEFLPISSTGHIILAEQLLHFEGPAGKVFEIVIQLGAILAVCVLYYAKIFATIGGVIRRDPLSRRFATAVIVAFLPAAVIGVALHKHIKALLDKPIVVAVAFIVGGIVILIIERYAQRPRVKSVDDIGWKTALFIGFCQCLAMIPGVSRSGATIMGARVLRVTVRPRRNSPSSSPFRPCSERPSTISTRTGRRWTGTAAG
jgi:undecaprenyl-diphosphatase